MVRSPPTFRVKLTKRDIAWLLALHRHGMLSASHLHEFTKADMRSARSARYRLRQLLDSGYLDRPWQQQDTAFALNNMMVYALTEAGETALGARNLVPAKAQAPSRPWAHSLMVSSITASIELEAGKHGVRFIGQDGVFSRSGASPGAKVRFAHGGQAHFGKLIPDRLFGLQYQTDKGAVYRFFLLEADRGTEPHRAANFARKSHVKTILQYREFIGCGMYRRYYGLSANILVLHVTRSAVQMNNIMGVIDEFCGGGIFYMLF